MNCVPKRLVTSSKGMSITLASRLSTGIVVALLVVDVFVIEHKVQDLCVSSKP